MTSPITTNIPQRIDRLPWSRWHWLVIGALGITWILDGLEVTIVGALGPVLTHPETLGLTESEVGLTASAYLAGSVSGALFFSHFIDAQGRKRWFMLTLLLYLLATVLTALSWNLWSFMLFRFLTGAGVGGESAAINSAIDELVPARVRGHAGLALSGTWWVGTAAGALISIPLLDTRHIPVELGWRLCFGLGSILSFAVLLVRRAVPESPRWLVLHGRVDEAEVIVRSIEERVMHERGLTELEPPQGTITLHQKPKVNVAVVARQLFRTYPDRAFLCFSLMLTQSFLYNAIFFTYALVLTKFYAVPTSEVGLYILPFAVSNFLGPVLLGRLFDSIGRKRMIALTYTISAVCLAITGWLFVQGHLTAVTQTVCWSVIFFFASAGASAAYLTVSEVFPLEIRAMAIAVFFVIGQGGGAVAPWVFGHLVQSSATSVFYGDLVGSGFMLIGAITALLFGVNAERRSLEHIAPPLSEIKG